MIEERKITISNIFTGFYWYLSVLAGTKSFYRSVEEKPLTRKHRVKKFDNFEILYAKI